MSRQRGVSGEELSWCGIGSTVSPSFVNGSVSLHQTGVSTTNRRVEPAACSASGAANSRCNTSPGPIVATESSVCLYNPITVGTMIVASFTHFDARLAFTFPSGA
jgi:hypothetical protein